MGRTNETTKYLAHISGDGKREQSLIDHLKGTSRLAGQFAAEFGFRDWGECCGLLHDIGKYSEKFQERLRGSAVKVDHATAGARVCEEQGGFYGALGYCIAGHHAGLSDTGGTSDEGTCASYCGRMKKRLEEYGAYRREVAVPALRTPFFAMTNPETAGFTMSFFIRMLYSCLVDADYLDTERFMQNGESGRDAGESLPVLWDRLRLRIGKWLENTEEDTINGRRSEILRHCIQMGDQEPGIFRMTAPTGAGKTVASLAFALRHAVKHDRKRIVYVVPYTSIIEQNAAVFRDILGEKNVLEHHSGVEYEDEEELRAMQLAAENWDKPVVVTTNVQFFESLFSNKSSKCRKLHNLANSVILLDEVQMLPNDYLKPCVAALEELATHYNASVVLCTATQPALTNLFSTAKTVRELCPRREEQFAFFQRAQICKLGTLSQEELATRLCRERQALCILNTRKETRRLYEALQGEGVYHLSTLMYPLHRKRVLEEIRCRLAEDGKCLVISTSLVEAGVDLDFQSVYRQLAGIDSVIQAAGRCNREGTRSKEESFTYVFQLEDAGKVPGQDQQIDVARLVMREYEDMASLSAVEGYFRQLYDIRGEGLDKKQILKQCEAGGFVFAQIAKQFKLIEQETKTIFIAKEDGAQALLQELRQKEASRQRMRRAGQYSVEVYQNLFERLKGAGMLRPVAEEWKEEWFMLRDEADYSEETGLRIDVEMGRDIWY